MVHHAVEMCVEIGSEFVAYAMIFVLPTDHHESGFRTSLHILDEESRDEQVSSPRCLLCHPSRSCGVFQDPLHVRFCESQAYLCVLDVGL